MKRILLAGNPNVGKSTVFNALTGQNQHTGNWIGKTVTTAKGEFSYNNEEYIIYDLPGTYSLNAHSKEEEVARDACFYEEYDAIVVVVDALSLERNLNLVLQILEITNQVVLCVNLMDEAKKVSIDINREVLSKKLGIPVVLASARKKEGLDTLLDSIEFITHEKIKNTTKVRYSKKIEESILLLEERIDNNMRFSKRFIATHLIFDKDFYQRHFSDDEDIRKLLTIIHDDILTSKIKLDEEFSHAYASKQESLIDGVVIDSGTKNLKGEKIDKFLTNKTGILVMLGLLMLIFFITIVLSNYPSNFLMFCFSKLENLLLTLFSYLHVPKTVTSCLISGVFKTLSWVAAVMLPPMTIFFPLFSILEDVGYLPRVAFNMDGIFSKCGACGKQALTMMMGFGCNAVGVTGTRIIDSKKERLLAIVTNNFVPCNGRFPMLIALISMFLIGSSIQNISKVLVLTGLILFSCFMTFFISLLLSKTVLKGENTTFTMELPPFRRPEVLKVIVRSFKDKTLHVLKRAIVVSIPAGFLIWTLANFNIGEISILSHITNFLDPFARLIGLDGVILASFILGLPANEIVIPIMLMSYASVGEMIDYSSLTELKNILVNNGWTVLTALCTCIFSIFHFPCSTTIMTTYSETKSLKWTILSFLIPTLTGILLCIIVTTITKFIL